MLTNELLDKACIVAVKNYLNITNKPKFTDDYIKENYSLAIETIKDNYKKSIMAIGGLSGVSSITQGSQSISFNSDIELNNFISTDVKMLLPRPYIRLY